MEELSFVKSQKKLLSALRERVTLNQYNPTPQIFDTLDIDSSKIYLKQADDKEEIIFKSWFGRYINPRLSGYVAIKVIPAEVFSNSEGFIFYVFALKKYGGKMNSNRLVKKDFAIERHNSFTDLWYGIARVKHNEVFRIKAIEGEKEIVDAVEVAARLAKSLSRRVVPITNIETGEVVDYSQVGYEDVIFIEILRHYLVRERMRQSVA
jgi:hypothetical protein